LATPGPMYPMAIPADPSVLPGLHTPMVPPCSRAGSWPPKYPVRRRAASTSDRITVDGKAVESTPKTNSGRRTIWLDAQLVTLLRRHQATQAAEKLRAGEAYPALDHLVADELGRPYYPGSISRWFKQQAATAGLRVIRLHDTRHTAASLLLADGVPVPVVSEMLGHSSPTITLSIYAHAVPGMADQAGAALSASLLGSTQTPTNERNAP
jgi:integrase